MDNAKIKLTGNTLENIKKMAPHLSKKTTAGRLRDDSWNDSTERSGQKNSETTD